MEWYWAFALLLSIVMALMMLGFPIAIAFIIANLAGIVIFIGPTEGGMLQLVENMASSLTSFTLSPIPMFLLMGSLFFNTRVAMRVFDGLDVLIGRIPGRLSYVTLAGGTIFATLTGSSMANTAMLGSVMVPEMQRRGYSWRMSLGPILGTGSLAMIIPPSSLGVLLASMAKIDVGQLLVAGLLPGLLMAGLFGVIIYVQLRLNPAAAPSYEVQHFTLRQKLLVVCTNLLPVSLVIFVVIGFIILGISTPTEAAAFGVAGVMVLAACFRLLTWTSIRRSLEDTVKVASMIFLILMSSTVFSQLLAYSGAASGLLHWTLSLDITPGQILLLMLVILLFLGMFMDGVSMMLITVPIYFPVANLLGVDPILLGVLMLLLIDIGGITPPFGMQLYVMLGVAPKGTTLFRCASAVFPFLLCDLFVAGLLILFPAIALLLPELMR